MSGATDRGYANLVARIEALENDKEFAEDLVKLRSQEVTIDRQEYQSMADEIAELRRCKDLQEERLYSLEERLKEEKQTRHRLEDNHREIRRQINKLGETLETLRLQTSESDQEVRNQIARLTETLVDVGKRVGDVSEEIQYTKQGTKQALETANRALQLSRKQKTKFEGMNSPITVEERFEEIERQLRNFAYSRWRKSAQVSGEDAYRVQTENDTRKLLEEMSSSLTSPFRKSSPNQSSSKYYV